MVEKSTKLNHAVMIYFQLIKTVKIQGTGKILYIWESIKDFIPLVSTIVIQLVPVWILFLLIVCLDIQFDLNSFLENMLVYDIVAGGAYLIENSKNREDKDNGKGKGQHIRLLSVLVVILASVAYAGLLLTTNSIGPAGVMPQKNNYITVTVGITQFTMLVQYFGLKESR